MTPATPNIEISTTPAIEVLLKFAAVHSPYYSQFEWAEKLRQGRDISFEELPITTKTTVRANAGSFFCEEIPASEGMVHDLSTSGSTGEPMPIRKTDRHFQMNERENQRLRSGWSLGEFRRVMICTSASSRHPAEMEQKSDKVGRMVWTVRTLNPSRIMEWFERLRPSLLQGFPSTMVTVLENIKDPGNLKMVATTGEIVTDEFHVAMQRLTGCKHHDSYGAKEVGLIASQCLTCSNYHVADRHMIVEILDDEGKPVPRGSMGRVVITPLYNLAMPLIRYEIGDYAMVSGDNACARSSVSLGKIIGRERNLFTLPNGTRITPHFPNSMTRALGLSKVKLVQLNRRDVEIRYIPLSPDTELGVEQAQAVIDIILSPEMRAIPVRVESLPAVASGKYLMHESLI